MGQQLIREDVLTIAGLGGYPGAAEVVNLRAPAALLREVMRSLPCLGDGRQSATSGSSSILNASPKAAAGGELALLKSGDRVRIDLKRGTADVLIDKAELDRRRRTLEEAGGYPYPASQTPWQEFQRAGVGQMETAPSWKVRKPTSASPRPAACRATTSEDQPCRMQRSTVPFSSAWTRAGASPPPPR